MTLEKQKHRIISTQRTTQRTVVHLSIIGGGHTGDEVEYLKDDGSRILQFDRSA